VANNQKPSQSAQTVQTSRSVHRTEEIAGELATRLEAGQCIALEGELGAGKTQFVRGLAQGLGISPLAVSSPTYVLLNVYGGGRLTLYHLDAYRVRRAEDFEAVGFTELLDQNGVVVVEWASRIEGILPKSRIEVHLKATGVSTREITIIERQPRAG
jgi:tRNA threonylcarbamoyladenosine biosynthesis protein TsaE